MKRRAFLHSAVATSLAASPLAAALASGQSLPRTPRDHEGPFYPVAGRNRTNDLVIGEPREPVLHLRGRVLTTDGAPVTRGLVDIWHTDPLGRYKHPRDPSPGDRWNDFLYWGEAITDTAGRFEFRTYVPGAYNRRPSHIHYKVWHNRRRLLTSQIYFRQTGGTRGASRDTSKAELQTVDLVPDGDTLRCYVQVVI